jgi:hypothetical protein
VFAEREVPLTVFDIVCDDAAGQQNPACEAITGADQAGHGQLMTGGDAGFAVGRRTLVAHVQPPSRRLRA